VATARPQQQLNGTEPLYFSTNRQADGKLVVDPNLFKPRQTAPRTQRNQPDAKPRGAYKAPTPLPNLSLCSRRSPTSE